MKPAREVGGEMRHKPYQKAAGSMAFEVGFGNIDKISAKRVLAVKLNELIDTRKLSQIAVAQITGMTQPKVSQVRRYKLQNISLERLMQALVSLDQRVEIVVRPAQRMHGAGITVAA
jgi:predicted XRE-type DNA-binding protein